MLRVLLLPCIEVSRVGVEVLRARNKVILTLFLG